MSRPPAPPSDRAPGPAPGTDGARTDGGRRATEASGEASAISPTEQPGAPSGLAPEGGAAAESTTSPAPNPESSASLPRTPDERASVSGRDSALFSSPAPTPNATPTSTGATPDRTGAPAAPPEPPIPLLDRLASGAFLGLVGVLRLLPYPQRIAAMGWIFAHVAGPLAGWRRRIRANLTLASPELTRAEVRRLTRAVPDNAGRALMEIYAGTAFTARVTATDPLEGPGLPVLEQAAAAGRPVILACAHFGNYDAMRAALAARGWPVGALYRPMNNRAFNRHYIPAIEAIAQPLFPRAGRGGLAAMIRFLRQGGMLCLGFDQYDRHGATLRFFGLPTETVLTPAELALKYHAPLVPIAGIRQPDGLSFRVRVGAPVPPGTPQAMMQALNDDLESLVAAHPDQWFWVHRRWKNLAPPGAAAAAPSPLEPPGPASPADPDAR